jgi:pyruvate dehydrogenase E2 component (dihydrolipoamide acetyltransferase)
MAQMETRKRLSGAQRAVARLVAQSASTIPHVTTIREIRMDRVLQAKERLKARFERLTVLPFVVLATAKVLKTHPELNASLDGEEAVYHTEINIGVAVAVGADLKVPIIHNAGKLDFEAIVGEVNLLARKAANNAFTIADFRGGTFTISNSGAFGGEIFTPIINYPQSAILGMGRIAPKPVVDADGAIVSRPMMYLCLSYDHRIINGAQAVTFLGELERRLAGAQDGY